MPRLVLLSLLVLAACAPSNATSGSPARARGVVVAKVLPLGAPAAARVEHVLVLPGARVERDAVLVQFDARALTVRRDEAAAEVARASAELARLEKGARVEEIQEARARCDELALRVKGASDAERPLLDAQFAAAQARFGFLSKGARKEELDAARAAVQAAQARQRELALAPVELRAPMPALVHRVAAEDGATVAEHELVVTLRDPLRLFVEADLAPLGSGWQTGASVWLTSSLLPDQRFEGRVLELSVPAAPADASRETEHAAFVRARIEVLDGRDLLAPGSAVEVELAR